MTVSMNFTFKPQIYFFFGNSRSFLGKALISYTSFRFAMLAEIEDSPIGNGSCCFVERRREVPPMAEWSV